MVYASAGGLTGLYNSFYFFYVLLYSKSVYFSAN